MEIFAAFGGGLVQLLSPPILLALIGGTLFGWIFGILPGLGPLNAMAIALPLSFWWHPITGMYFFAGIMGAASQGGAITSILLNMPGTAQNAATMFDGHPLARQGRAGWALGIAAGTSVYGAYFGILVLIVLIPVFLPILLAFGPAEKFWLMIFGLMAMTLAVQADMAKSFVAVGLGVLLTFVGLGGPEFPVERFTFGSTYLLDGLNLVAVLIGLLVVSESIAYLAQGIEGGGDSVQLVSSGATGHSFRKELAEALRGLLVPFRYPVCVLRSSLIGTGVGAIPGVGGVVAQFLSYDAARAASRHPELFGRGNPEGLIAAESAVNAKEGGTLLPTLLFGIPGNAETALLLGAWQIYGIQAGPYFLERHADLAWALILGLFFSNTVASVLTVLTVGATSWVPRLDIRYLAPSILVLVALSLVALRGSVLDLGVGVLAGILGFALQRLRYPVIGTVIGFVLGGAVEQNFYTALQSSRGSYQVFLGSAISLSLFLATFLVPALVFFSRFRRRFRGGVMAG
ncbi:MAG: tripartite tricarboxylate transporter permease [Deltaproteobacteria bacterium]|nr:tripartite tricarboxylate transporter permease [Deltaproteobacteria bacterium]